TVAPGATLPFGPWTLKNQGTAAAIAKDGNFTHKVYLSHDNTLDANDIALGVAGTTLHPLDAGATWLFGETTVGPLPTNTTPGSYYLLLLVDALHEVSEVNEQNNLVAIPVTVEVPNVPPVASDSS